MNSDENRQRRFETATKLVHAATGEMSSEQLTLGWRRLSDRLEERAGGRWRAAWAPLAWSSIVVLVIGLGAMFALRGREKAAALEYAVDGGTVKDAGYIQMTNPAGAKLRFSDGTQVSLGARARGRLTAVDALGARVAIEEGRAEVKVFPRKGGRWLFHAGPFLIAVKGTSFAVDWAGGEDRLEVRMHTGIVTVTGPVAQELTLRAGQRLTVRLREKEVVIRNETDYPLAPAGPPPPAPSPPSEAPPAREPPPANGREPSTRSGRVGAADVRPTAWKHLLAAGNLDEILAQAQARGYAASVARGSSEDLIALADAARYSGHNDLARQALLAQRRRFPRSHRARDAAFFLGRMEEDAPSGSARALGWYERYLREAPSGLYADETMGRKMAVVQRLHGNENARAVAEEYLRRFPSGSYAQAARLLLAPR